MGQRFQQRRRNGRFTRNTLENTFGITVDLCSATECRRLTTRNVGVPSSGKCWACGAPVIGAEQKENA